jgi:hypothetical protein
VHRDVSEENEGKRPLGRPRHGWEDIIKMIFREINFECVY